MSIEQQPEAWIIVKREQDSITDATLMDYMPNGSAVSNVYEAYEEGRKSVMFEQEPVAWCQMVEGKVQDLLTSFEMKDWIYDKSWMPLYLAPPKPTPLSEKEIEEYINSLRSSAVSEEYYSEEWEEGFEDGVRWLEKQLENKQ
jgi:hypothetical protein